MSVLKIKQNGEWIPVGEYPLADVAFSGSYDDLKDLPDLSLSGNGEEEVVSFTMNTAGWIDNVYQKIEELYPGTQYDVEVFFDGKNGNKTTKQYYDNMELTGSPDNNYLYCYGSYDDNEDDLIILESGVPLILKVVKK